MGQRKAFYRQRIPESSCTRKETVDIDILVTSRNGDGKIMQSIGITSRPPSRKRTWNQLSQFRWTSTKVIPIKDLSWLHFNNEPRVHERRQVQDQEPCISVFVAYPTITSNSSEQQPRHDNTIPCKAVWWI